MGQGWPRLQGPFASVFCVQQARTSVAWGKDRVAGVQVNVVGALEQGWNCHLYQNTPALRKDLRKRKILRNFQGPFDAPRAPPSGLR